MGIHKINRVYKADDSGLADLGTFSSVGDATLAAAERLAGNAEAVGHGTYEAVRATVTAGWANERRTGAIVRESAPDFRDSRDAILRRVLDSMGGRRT